MIAVPSCHADVRQPVDLALLSWTALSRDHQQNVEAHENPDPDAQSQRRTFTAEFKARILTSTTRA
jgi:hypothetical protein